MKALATVLASLALVTGCNDQRGALVATDCSGRRLSCESVGARRLPASRYERDRHCFAPRAELSGVCALPVGCPGGGGEIVCLARNGEAYAAFMQFGEQLSDPSWHNDSGAELEPTVTEAEQKRCDELRQSLQAAANRPDAGSIVLQSWVGETFAVAPACTN